MRVSMTLCRHYRNAWKVHLTFSRWSSCLLVASSARAGQPLVGCFLQSCSSFRSQLCPLSLASWTCPIRHDSFRLFGSSTTPQDNDKSDEEIEEETMKWVRNVVVGWNLCPFAEKPLRSGSLHVNTVRGKDEDTILGVVLGEMLVRRDTPGTTLVIAPDCYPNDFGKYLEFVTTLEEDLMDEYNLSGQVQVAPFHPRFEFQGSGSDGVDNYTNRAPYPIFHVLREPEVASAVDKLGGDASRVWKRNVDLLEDMETTLGRDGVKGAVAGSSNLTEKVQEVLKRHRFNLREEE